MAEQERARKGPAGLHRFLDDHGIVDTAVGLEAPDAAPVEAVVRAALRAGRELEAHLHTARPSLGVIVELEAICEDLVGHGASIDDAAQQDAPAVEELWARQQGYRERLEDLVAAVGPVIDTDYALAPYRDGVGEAMEHVRDERERLRAAGIGGETGCVDCGESGTVTGHQECPYPGRYSSDLEQLDTVDAADMGLGL